MKTPKLKFSTVHVKRLLYISLPMGFEYSISALGAIVMQVAINHMGSAIVIAQTAGEKSAKHLLYQWKVLEWG